MHDPSRPVVWDTRDVPARANTSRGKGLGFDRWKLRDLRFGCHDSWLWTECQSYSSRLGEVHRRFRGSTSAGKGGVYWAGGRSPASAGNCRFSGLRANLGDSGHAFRMGMAVQTSAKLGDFMSSPSNSQQQQNGNYMPILFLVVEPGSELSKF